MGQYVVGRLTAVAAWLVAAVIVGLNLMLAVDEIGGWLAGAGSWAWLLWLTVVPASAGLAALLVYVTVLPALQRRRGDATPAPEGVHGPMALPSVEPAPGPRRIAVALDFSSADAAVLSYAVTVARTIGRGAEVMLLHVVEAGGAHLLGPDHVGREAHSDQERLELYTSELTELGVRARYDLGFGEPVASLVELVKEHEADLVILGSHGHRAVGDFVLGTAVDRLRHRIGVPVLVVPGAKMPAA